MGDVFRQLLETLNQGSRAALLSEYHGAGVKRAFVREGDQAAWDNLEKGDEGIALTKHGEVLRMVELYAAKPRLIILGGGHIALPLAHFGANLGFGAVVYDDRLSFANAARFPDAEAVICDSFDNLAANIKINRSDYVVIVTRGHRHDSLCLSGVLKGEFPRYVGMIGSRRRIGIVKKQLEEETGESEKLSKLHAPIGLSLGAVTPGEIAVSILAEIIKEMRQGGAEPGGAPVRPLPFLSPDMELFAWLAAEGREDAALATVVAAEGSTPRATGAKMAILPHGKTVGSIGGGCAEADVMIKALDIIRDGGHCLMEIDLSDSAEDEGMVCGGTMKILLEKV